MAYEKVADQKAASKRGLHAEEKVCVFCGKENNERL